MSTPAPPLPYEPPKLAYIGLGRYVLTADFTVTIDGRTFTVPAGYRTDLATVPRIFWWLIPPTGAYEIAAVLHDWLCVRLAAFYRRPDPLDGAGLPPATARETDRIFRQLMRMAGVGPVLAWVMWVGVRWGALMNPARRPGWLRDSPLVLAISFVLLVLVLLVLVGVHHLVEIPLSALGWT